MTQTNTENTVKPVKTQSNLKITLIALLAGAVGFMLLTVVKSCHHKTVINNILDSDTVKNADKKSHDAVELSIQEIHQFFEDTKKNVPTFVDKTLGIKSKFYAASEYIPFVEDDKSQKYITDCFEETIFNDEKIKDIIERSLKDYFKEVEDVESMMLFNLREDLPDVSTGVFRELSYDSLLEQFKKQQNGLTTQLTGVVDQETVGSLINFVVTEVLTLVATNLIVSSGILGTSGATAPETFGISIVLGIVADALVSFTWNKIKDPKGKLVRIMNEELDKTEKLIIYGEGETWQGLRSYLENLNDTRTAQRKEILRRILSASDIEK